jgi:DNA-binding CsgD family transcriptional regulator/PAS domain-containing protein
VRKAQTVTDIRAVSSLIGQFYDAALDPTRWRPALADLAGMVSAKAAAIQSMNPLNNALLFSIDQGNDPRWIELLHITYAALCPMGPFVLLAETCKGGSIFDYIDETEYRETRFYREWCAPQGFYDLGGAMLTKEAHQIGTLSLFGNVDRGRFTPAEIDLMGIIAPHVRRAVTIAGLLNHQAANIENFRGLVDRLATAVLMLSGNGQIIHANAAATRLIDGGGAVKAGKSGLSFSDPVCENSFRRALAQKQTEPTIFTISQQDGHRSVAAVLALDAASDVHAIFFHQPAPELPAAGKQLVEAFGFTPREIAVLLPMLQGKDVSEIAAELGIAVATARTHVQRLFEKTRTNRQADLVRVVMQTMPPVLM